MTTLGEFCGKSLGGGDGPILSRGVVVERSQVAPDCVNLLIRAPEISVAASPGQFVMVRGWQGYDPLLSRPFSFCRLHPAKGQFEILFKVVGSATRLMARWSGGQELWLQGPLGRGFPVPASLKRAAIVSRGMGVAPMIALARAMADRGLAVRAFLSSSCRRSLVGYEELGEICEGVLVSTDDGSLGQPGLVTDLLERELDEYQIDAVYTCGSKRLAKAIYVLQQRFEFEAYISLEEAMACGMGACKGCVRKVRSPGGGVCYATVCRDGPVFPLERVLLE